MYQRIKRFLYYYQLPIIAITAFVSILCLSAILAALASQILSVTPAAIMGGVFFTIFLVCIIKWDDVEKGVWIDDE